MGHYNAAGFYVFAAVTSTDRAGLLWVASILSLLFCFVTLAVRYHIKKRTFGKDDWFIVAATVFATAQYIALFIGMDDYGLGKSSKLLSEDEAISAGRSVFASNCLFVIGLALSKCSVVFFMKRLFTRDFRVAWMICNILLATIAVWVVASILILVIGCGPSSKLLGDRCPGQILRWGIVAALDSVLEFVIMILAVVLVWPLQMSFEIKLTVVFAFFFRIFVVVFALMHIARIAHYSKSSDPGLAVIGNLIWQQVELGYSLISATIPTLRSFIRGYEKAMGWEASYSKSHTDPPMFGTASYPMQSYRSKNGSNRSGNHEIGIDHDDNESTRPNLRPDKSKYKANIYGPGDQPHKLRREPSTGSSDSEHPIIRKDVHFSVSSETSPSSPWTATL